MARPKKQTTAPNKPLQTALNSLMPEPITPPIPTVKPENPVETKHFGDSGDSGDETAPHEFEIIKSRATCDYHLDRHIIPAGGVYRLPGETYRKYSGRRSFDAMFEDGTFELVGFE